MITSVKEKDIELIYNFCKDSLLGAKIFCQLSSYGLDRDFFDVWFYSDVSEISAVIARFENSITLLADNLNNTEEIKAFLNMLCYTSLCCSQATAETLGFDTNNSKNAYIYCGEGFSDTLENLHEECYKDAYRLICLNIPDSFEDSDYAYLSFLSDFTFRKRRGAARIKGTVIDGKVASCALTSAETDFAAVISGVACDSSLRQKGLGKRTVLALADELTKENKKVYVIALNKSAEGFYEHIGFKNTEKITFIERK